jgi:hypothetical protein
MIADISPSGNVLAQLLVFSRTLRWRGGTLWLRAFRI